MILPHKLVHKIFVDLTVDTLTIHVQSLGINLPGIRTTNTQTDSRDVFSLDSLATPAPQANTDLYGDRPRSPTILKQKNKHKEKLLVKARKNHIIQTKCE